VTANWLAELDGRRIGVEVPATSANLGAGYDCLGLALDLTDRIEVEVRSWSRGQIELEIDGEGVNELTEDRQNRFIQSLETTLVKLRGAIPDGVGWRVSMHNRIPLMRGLGSSAAATVAGIVAADALAEAGLSTAEMLQMASDIEGHPDNVGAAMLGGFVVSAAIGDGVEALRFDVPRDLRCVLYIPDLRLQTEAMRDALPAVVPFADAVTNLGRVALGVAGMAGRRVDLLRFLTIDRLHEPYRAEVYPQLPRLVEAARDAGALGACLSGSGSTIIAFTDSVASVARIEAALSAVAADTDLPGHATVVAPRNAGAKVVHRS
jgi:homoserine kinase